MGKVKAGSWIPLPIVPIVLVGAKVNGKPNYMAVGAVSVVNNRPPIVMVSLTKTHHTPKGIIENGTFSINIPSSDLVIETDYCGLASGKTTDKSNIFTSFYGELETAPMIEECPITFECKLIDKKEVAYCIVYFGEVHKVYADEGERNFDITQVNPMFLNYGEYRSIGESKSLGKCYKIGRGYKGSNKQIGSKVFIRGPQYIEKEEFEVIGIEDFGKEGRRSMAQLWGNYEKTITNNPETSYGFEIYMTPNWESKKGGDRRIIGCKKSYMEGRNIEKMYIPEDIPEGLVLVTIPAQKYAVFTHIGNADNFMETIRYIYGEWLPNNKKYERVPGAPEFAYYDIRFEPDSDSSEFDWYIPIHEKSSLIKK
jgi:flavin reductase (DIM6/NTAB) family NADH-FMN oxidoreductase RutF/predicted transcriptional regulator YdeE